MNGAGIVPTPQYINDPNIDYLVLIAVNNAIHDLIINYNVQLSDIDLEKVIFAGETGGHVGNWECTLSVPFSISSFANDEIEIDSPSECTPSTKKMILGIWTEKGDSCASFDWEHFTLRPDFVHYTSEGRIRECIYQRNVWYYV